MSFDVKAYLEDRGVYFATEGKNLSFGWIGIQCPFCDDPSVHCGINLAGGYINCFVCGAGGSVKKVVAEIEHCSFDQASKIMAQYNREYDELTQKREVRTRVIQEQDVWPKEARDVLLYQHQMFLVGRGYDPYQMREIYKIRCTMTSKLYPWSIIIPVYQDGRLVAFTSRSITEKFYRNSREGDSIKSVKECLYNLDTVHRKIIIVEGPLDVWRLGPGAVATFGTLWTPAQVELLSVRDIKQATVIYDSEYWAQRQGQRLANQLSAFIPLVGVIDLGSGDPGDLSSAKVLRLREIYL